MNDNTADQLKSALASHGAREFEVVALSLDPHRALSALNYAVAKGAEHPISYAIKLFDNENWKPSGETRRVAVNQSVDKTCTHCGGDRFVPVTAGLGPYEETYAPCKVCNAGANTVRWVGNERRETVPR